MIETIISNNCVGGAVMHQLGMEFKSPTVNLQILPERFPDFCWDIEYYMNEDLVEVDTFSRRETASLKKMFGGIPDIPIGAVGDVLVCFQHYETFEEAAAKWNERKAKIDYDNIGYIFHARGPEYIYEAAEFLDLKLPNSLCITEGFDLEGAVRLKLEPGQNGFSAINGHLAILDATDFKAWREQG